MSLWSISGATVLAVDFSKGLVNCGKNEAVTNAHPAATDCTFSDAIDMIDTLIRYLIMIAIPVASIAFAYAGWLYLSAGENSGQVTKARTIFLDVGIGFIIILAGWLLFTLIAQTFLKPGEYGTYLK